MFKSKKNLDKQSPNPESLLFRSAFVHTLIDKYKKTNALRLFVKNCFVQITLIITHVLPKELSVLSNVR